MTSSEKSRETRRRNAEVRENAWRERRENRQSVQAAMRRVLDDPSSTPGQLVRAAELLTEMER